MVLVEYLEDYLAKLAILQLKEERRTALHRRVEADVVKNAKAIIVRIFPDKKELDEILRLYPVSFIRPRIYALLPKDIRGGM